jgi:hypothetical protein
MEIVRESLLQPFVDDDHVSLTYRESNRRLHVSLSLADLSSDQHSVLEVSARNL